MRFWTVLILLVASSLKASTSHRLQIGLMRSGIPTSVLEVSPGETLDLFADSWVTGPGCGVATGCPEHRSPDEFLWSSDDHANAVCDLFSASACGAETDFEVTQSGVRYRVPDSFPGPITIMTRERGEGAMGTLVLTPRAPAPQVSYAEPAVNTTVVVVPRPAYWHYHPYYRPWFPPFHSHWRERWHPPVVRIVPPHRPHHRR